MIDSSLEKEIESDGEIYRYSHVKTAKKKEIKKEDKTERKK